MRSHTRYMGCYARVESMGIWQTYLFEFILKKLEPTSQASKNVYLLVIILPFSSVGKNSFPGCNAKQYTHWNQIVDNHSCGERSQDRAVRTPHTCTASVQALENTHQKSLGAISAQSTTICKSSISDAAGLASQSAVSILQKPSLSPWKLTQHTKTHIHLEEILTSRQLGKHSIGRV